MKVIVLVGVAAVLVLVGLSLIPSRSPDAIDHVVANHCNADGSQDFTYVQNDGQERTLHLGTCVIKK